MKKNKVAFYWAGSCGGCEITITELGMNLIDFADQVEILFWPAILDFKYSDVKALMTRRLTFVFLMVQFATRKTNSLPDSYERNPKGW